MRKGILCIALVIAFVVSIPVAVMADEGLREPNGMYIGEAPEDVAEAPVQDALLTEQPDGKEPEQPGEEPVEPPPIEEVLPDEVAAEQAEADISADIEEQLATQQAAPVDIRTYFAGGSGSILSSLALTFQDSKGNAVTTPTVDSIVNMNFGISIPPEVTAQIQNGDYYKFSLPNNLSVPVAINNIELYDTSSPAVLYGYFSVATDGTVTITFTGAATSSAGLSGSMFFSSKINKAVVTQPGVQTLSFPSENGLSAQFTIASQPTSQIGMGGSVFSNTITWTVTINPALATLSNVVLTERLPSTLVYDSVNAPVQVYQTNVDVYGNPVGTPTLVDPAGGVYTADPNGSVSFLAPISGAYQMVYTTVVNPAYVPGVGGKLDFTNNATLTANELSQPVSGRYTVSKTFHGLLEVLNTSAALEDSPDTPGVRAQTFGWLLRYNYQQNSIVAPSVDFTYDPTPTDGKQLAVVPGSIAVYPVDIVNDIPVRSGTPLPSSAYTVTQGSGSFNVTFGQPINTAYDIIYKTYATGIVQTDFVKTTTISSGTATPVTDATYVWQQAMAKAVLNVDRQNSLLTWEIVTNQNNYTMDNFTINETLTGNQVFVDGSVVIYDLYYPYFTLTQGTDFTFNYDSGLNQLSFAFKGAYASTTHELLITYVTDYSADPSSGKFTGTAVGNWGGGYQATAYAEYNAIEPELNNGAKFGSYDPITKELTWVILVDYANTGLKNAYIKDPIVNNLSANPNSWQYFIPHSTKIYRYTIDPVSGDPDFAHALRGGEIDYSEVAISEPAIGAANPELNVQFVASKNPPVKYWVEYRTSLHSPDSNGNYYIMGNYINSATLHNDYSVDHALNASVNINNGGNLLSLSGNQGSDGYAHWSMTVNASQSSLTKLQVKSDLSQNQTIQMDSLDVYYGIVDQNGNVSADTRSPLTPGTDYTATYAPTGSGGAMQLVLNLYPSAEGAGYTGSKVFVAEYKAAIAMAPGEQVTNSSYVSSAVPADMVSSDTETVPVTVMDAGGILVGNRVSFSIKKTGEAGTPEAAGMAGVVFQLYDKGGNKVGGDYTTDANGVINFKNVVKGNYYLKEISTLPGYIISSDLLNGRYLVPVNETTGQVNVANTRGKMVATVLGNGAPLEAGKSAEVDLYQMQNGSFTRVKAGIKTNSSSQLSLVGLGAGKYQLRETVAPAGFILNTQPTDFEVVIVSGTPQLTSLVTIDNYQGSYTFIKTDNRSGGAGKPLSDAEFTIENASGTAEYSAKVFSADDGVVLFEKLIPGKYTVRETNQPPGWPTEGSDITLNVEIPAQAEGKAGAIVKLSTPVTNALSGGTADAVVKDPSGKPLSGAVFSIYSADGSLVRSGVKTGANGTLIVTGLSQGEYYAVQTGAPDGFLVNPTRIPFTVRDGDMDGDPIDIGTLTNYQIAARLEKRDSSGNGIMGAVFELRASGGDVVRTGLMTDSAGLLRITGLNSGSYELYEVEAPSGFVLDSTPFAFEVPETAASQPEDIKLNGGKPFINYREAVKFKKTDESGVALMGAVFALSRTDGGSAPQITEYTSGADGSVTMGNLAPGSYSLAEKTAAPGFVRNTKLIGFTVAETQEGVQQLADFPNYRGSFILTQKDDRGKPVRGSRFELRNGTSASSASMDESSGVASSVLGVYKTDENGVIGDTGLAPGSYILRQAGEPEGYLPVEDIAFEIAQEAEGAPNAVAVAAVSKRLLGSIEILKTDGAGGLLAGVQFELRNSAGELVRGDIVTSDAGTAVISGLEPGTYSLVETMAPVGYLMDGIPKTVEIGDATKGEADTVKIEVVNKKIVNPSGGGGTEEGGSAGTTAKGGKTGDDTNIALYLSLIIVAAGVISATVLVMRRKKRANGK